MSTQPIRTEIAIRDDDKTARLINSVCELHRRNNRLALERSVFVVAFAVTLFVLICVLSVGR